jgi:hypothetical protein
VRLSKSGEILFWLQAAAPPLSGTIAPNGNVTLTTTQDLDVQDCSVTRTDTFIAALGTSAQPSAFTGSLAYHYDFNEDAGCTLLPLPCDVSYALTAKRQGD